MTRLQVKFEPYIKGVLEEIVPSENIDQCCHLRGYICKVRGAQ